MMDQDAKVKWVAALRSGDYKQGEGVLKSKDGCYCCLGVLAEVMNVPHRDFDEELDGRNAIASQKKSAQFIFDSENPDHALYGTVPNGFCGLSSGEKCELIDMNDMDKKSFAEIADFIEKNL